MTRSLSCKMEVKIVEDKKHKIIVEVKGVSHGFCNALTKELWSDKDTKSAGYHIDHPLIGVPRIILESKKDAKKALMNGIKRMKKKVSNFSKEFKKTMK